MWAVWTKSQYSVFVDGDTSNDFTHLQSPCISAMSCKPPEKHVPTPLFCTATLACKAEEPYSAIGTRVVFLPSFHPPTSAPACYALCTLHLLLLLAHPLPQITLEGFVCQIYNNLVKRITHLCVSVMIKLFLASDEGPFDPITLIFVLLLLLSLHFIILLALLVSALIQMHSKTPHGSNFPMV